MSKRRAGSPKKERLKEEAMRRLAKKKPEVLIKGLENEEETAPRTWIYIVLMIGGLFLLFIGTAMENLFLVIASMVISFYGSLRYSYVIAKTKPKVRKKAEATKVLGEEEL